MSKQRFEAIDVFNKIFNAEVTKNQYKGTKGFSDKHRKVIEKAIENLSTEDDSFDFDAGDILKKLNKGKSNNKFVLDKLVEATIDRDLKVFLSVTHIHDLLSERDDAVVVKDTLSAEFINILQSAILEDKSAAVVGEREYDVYIFTKLNDTLDENKDFYKFSLPELFLGHLEEGSPLLEFNPEQLIRYMEVNCYITYDAKAS